jgi:hypothetical protein
MNYGIKARESKGQLVMMKNGKRIREKYFDSRIKRLELMREWLKIVNYIDHFEFIIKLNENQL